MPARHVVRRVVDRSWWVVVRQQDRILSLGSRGGRGGVGGHLA